MTLSETLTLLRTKEKNSGSLVNLALSLKRYRDKMDIQILRVPAYAATDLVADALRETAAETSGCGRRANRNQPRISQATESIRVLTGHC
jgi:hypothetical protein